MADRPPSIAFLRDRLLSRFGRKRNVRRPGAVTALDFDSQTLRIVQAAPRGNRTVVTAIATAELADIAVDQRSDPLAVGRAIASALDNLQVKPAAVVMGVPRQLVVLRTLTLPQISDIRELASMVHMQIAKDLPFRLEEAVIDFRIREPADLPSSDASAVLPDATPSVQKIEVLVAVVRRETVEFFQKVAAAAKLKLAALGWLSQANARCVEACEVAEGHESVALVSLRPDEVSIDIVARRSLLFSRGAVFKRPPNAGQAEPAGPAAPEPTNPEEPGAGEPSAVSGPRDYTEAVTIEVVRSLHSYGGIEPQLPVARVAVTGSTGEERAMVQALGARLSIPCELLDPAAALDLSKGAREHADGAVAALGLGLGVNDPEGLPFDFLNPKRPAPQRDTRRIRMLALTAAGTALLIGVLGFRAHLVNQRIRVREQARAELVQAEKQLPLYRKMQQQAATLQRWAGEGRNWLEQYAYLSAVLPNSEDLYITSLSVSGQGHIHLAVQARSGEILASLDRQLRAAGYQVKPLAITPGNDRHGYNFRSSVELIVPAKMPIDLSTNQPPARPADDGSLDSKGRRKGGGS